MKTPPPPNFEDWRQRDALKIWQLAALMNGVDPRAWAIGDVAGRDGDALDLDDAQDQVIAGVHADAIQRSRLEEMPLSRDSFVKMPSVIDWLRQHRYEELANNLDRSRYTPRSDQIFKKKELVKRNISSWPTMEEDIKRASENGLDVAMAEGHGKWNEAFALDWARQNNKFTEKHTPAAQLDSAWARSADDA